MSILVQFGIVVSAGIAAWYWWLSARAPAPPMTWTGIGELQGWLDAAAKYNRRAATAAAMSAVLTGLSVILGWAGL